MWLFDASLIRPGGVSLSAVTFKLILFGDFCFQFVEGGIKVSSDYEDVNEVELDDSCSTETSFDYCFDGMQETVFNEIQSDMVSSRNYTDR